VGLPVEGLVVGLAEGDVLDEPGVAVPELPEVSGLELPLGLLLSGPGLGLLFSELPDV
jgi:hypothetical protein